MSEVIESFIRRHPGLSEEAAFEGLLQEERIRAWVGADPTRKERLRREFGRVWATMRGDAPPPPPAAAPAGSTARAGPAGPAAATVQPARTLRVEVAPEALAPAPPPAAEQPGARKLAVMCASCGEVDVWMRGDGIACRACGRVYDDMLQLIRVTPVGPFAFLFGEGWTGYATAAGLAGGLALLYFLFRGF